MAAGAERARRAARGAERGEQGHRRPDEERRARGSGRPQGGGARPRRAHQDAGGGVAHAGSLVPRHDAHDPQHRLGRRAGRRGRDGQRRRAGGGRAALLRLRTEAALGAVRIARHHRLRARREALRADVLHARRDGRAAAARGRAVDARPAPRAARLRGAGRAVPRPRADDGEQQQPAEVRRRALPRCGGGPVAHPDGGGAADEPARRRDTAAGVAAHQVHGAHAVLPAGAGRGGLAGARPQAPPPVREGRDVPVRRAGAVARRAGRTRRARVRRRARARAAVPHPAAVQRRPRLRVDDELRRGDLDARQRGVA